MLLVQLLGPLRAWHDGAELDLGPPGRRAVLGLLVLAGGEPVSRATLVDALWGDRPPASAVNVLQTYVKHLRRLLEPDRTARTPSELLPQAGGGYAIHLTDTDLARFRRLVAEADDEQRHGDTRRVAAVLHDAVRLWRGRPLADVPLLAGHPKVLALAEERWAAVARYGTAMIATGAAADALPHLTEAAAERPLDEPTLARLIRALHAAGRRATAFETYHRVRVRLAEELGIEPGPELVAAHTALLHHGVAGPRRSAPPAQLPADVPAFTGRAIQLSTLDALDAPVVAIAGTAGVGKTALAVHWARRGHFPDGQLYANLRGTGAPVRPIEVLAQFLPALGVPPDQVPTAEDTAAALYRTLLTDRKMVVLLDNAASADQVRPLLPGGPGCQVVVTSRNRLLELVGAHGLTLDVLTPDEAVELLARLVGIRAVLAEPLAAAELAKLCGYLPLALRIAAADLVDHPGGGIADRVAKLRDGTPLQVHT